MTAYKLFRQRKNGTLGPLFINRGQVIPMGEWVEAENHARKGFAVRPGWHACALPYAPHLRQDRGRVWARVELEDVTLCKRPAGQGEEWLLARRMRVLDIICPQNAVE
jgi:hypothetical protein